MSTETPIPERLDPPITDPLFARLFPRLATGVHFGLDRMTAALSALGDPHLGIPALHIGGTNGKGSVASTTASILQASGCRTGLYTSPHLCSVTERFLVGGRPLSEARLLELAAEIADVVVAHGLTFFEATTLLAFHAFDREQVDVQVIEVGLGGRLDATNVIHPLACALTNVQRDHAEFLGESLPEIAGEKAGIFKPGVPVVTAETELAQLAVFEQAAARAGTRLYKLDPLEDLYDVELGRDHTSFVLETAAWGRLALTTPLLGRHQATNAALAVTLVGLLPAELRPSADAVRDGVSRVQWPGRDQLEVVDGRAWLLDVAHNTAGIESLVAVLDRLELPRPHVAVVGVLGDKDWHLMLPPLLSRMQQAILTQPPSAPEGRRWDPDEVLATVRPHLRPNDTAQEALVTVEPDFGCALERARAAVASGGSVIVTGSCHTVGDALIALDRVPFEPGPA